MRAMVLEAPGRALLEQRVPSPRLGHGQLLIRIRACGVCRTDLHVCDGELAHAKLPLILGHQIVGTVSAIAEGVEGYTEGQRVGVPWLGRACGDCRYCRSDRENLCDRAEFTGYQLDGGYAEYTAVDPRFALPLPGSFSDLQAAPLLCAGLIGYRALSMTGDAERLGLYGFGSSAHIVAQVAAFQGRRVFAFTRPGDLKNQEFARKIGAAWAGNSDAVPPETLDAAIIFAPAGPLVPRALRAIGKGGAVICAGIHMSDIPSFPYELLWGERSLRSVANLTRRDGLEFLELAPRVPIHTEVQAYALNDANRALADLRSGNVSGALVLTL
jgi:alcohol dehydrogenase, propanol-preferring